MNSQHCALVPTSNGHQQIVTSGEKNGECEICEAQNTGTVRYVCSNLVAAVCVPSIGRDVMKRDCRENDIEADVCSNEQRQGTLGQIAKSVWQW